MTMSLHDIDFDLIERTANECGIPAFQFLRGVAKIVKDTATQKPAVAAAAEHRAGANGGDPSSPTQNNPAADPRTAVAAPRTCLEDTEKSDIRQWALALSAGSRFHTPWVAKRLRLARPLWPSIGRVLGFMVKEGHLAHDGEERGFLIYVRRNPTNVLGVK